MKKESFVFYETWAEAIRQMPDKERLQVYDAIMAYGIYGTKTDLGGLAQLAINMIYNNIDDMKAKRKERAEKNRQNVLQRWQNNTNVYERIQSNTNDTKRYETYHNVNVNVNGNVNDNIDTNSNSKISCSIESGANYNADKSATRKQPAKTLEERKNDFMWKIAEVGKGVYPDEMLRAFFDYWSEHNENGKKMLFEMKKTFDIKKRLATWASRENDNQFKHTNNGNNKIDFDRICELSDAMLNYERQ